MWPIGLQVRPWWQWVLIGGLALLLISRLTVPAADHHRVQAAVSALQGKVVIVDPGHGGRDGGATGVSGAREKEIVLAIALKLRDQLVANGATVVLTRDGDRDMRDTVQPVDGSKWRGELVARAAMAAEHGAHLLVSVHANAHGRGTPWKGAQAFWDPRGHPDSERLARTLMAALSKHTETRRVHRQIEQLVLARSGVPACTVEVGFLSNADEEKRLQDPAYQERLAGAVTAGITAFLATGPR